MTSDHPASGTAAHILAHSRSIRNRTEVLAATECGCFHCLRLFGPDSLTDEDWTHEATGDATALCPHCGMDSVIAGLADQPVTPELLKAMRSHWFGK